MVMKELAKPKKDRNETTISALVENLKQMKEDNSIFHFNVKNCPSCAFQTESTLALENHMEKIHKTLNQDFQKELLNMTDLDFYRCNICYYQTKNPQEIMKHIQEEMTKIDKQRSTKTASQFEAPIFLFDDRLRGKLNKQQKECAKKLTMESKQALHDGQSNNTPPPKIKNRSE